MPLGTTVTGVRFDYSGSLATGLVVSFRNSAMKITPDTIRIIRDEITKRSPVLMGANRKPLVADSVGETLWLEHRTTPQVMSYVLDETPINYLVDWVGIAGWTSLPSEPRTGQAFEVVVNDKAANLGVLRRRVPVATTP